MACIATDALENRPARDFYLDEGARRLADRAALATLTTNLPCRRQDGFAAMGRVSGPRRGGGEGQVSVDTPLSANDVLVSPSNLGHLILHALEALIHARAGVASPLLT